MRIVHAVIGMLLVGAAAVGTTHVIDDRHPRVVTHTVTKTETVVRTQMSQPCRSAVDAATATISEMETMYNTLVDKFNEWHRLDTWPIATDDYTGMVRDQDRWAYWSGQCGGAS